MGKTKNKIFVVWDGKESGIYKTWEECRNQVHGYAGAKYKGFDTEEEAQEAFLSPYWEHIGKNTKAKKNKHTLKAGQGGPVAESLSVDAACSGNPGLMEYRGVYTKTGEEIFKQGPFEAGTNNIGEFLALVHGIALLKQKNLVMPIYSDSNTALVWLKNKKVKTNLKPSSQNEKLFELIARAEKWLKENEDTTEVLKWETEVWGEIPADFGRK